MTVYTVEYDGAIESMHFTRIQAEQRSVHIYATRGCDVMVVQRQLKTEEPVVISRVGIHGSNTPPAEDKQ